MLQLFDFLYLRSGKAHERQATAYLLPVIIVFVSFVSTLNTKFWPTGYRAYVYDSLLYTLFPSFTSPHI